MKWTRVVPLMVVGVATWIGYRYRILAENWYWHLRHGDTLAIDEYRVPVPRNWFVAETGDKAWLLFRLDTDDHTADPRRDKRGRSHAFVGVELTNAALTSEKLKKITSFEASVAKQHRSEPASRNFEFDGEKLSCVGGRTLNQMLASVRPSAPPLTQFYEKEPNIWNCQSSGRLYLQLSGTDADMPQIWEIVSHIRKRS
jgi:hypothetical protein